MFHSYLNYFTTVWGITRIPQKRITLLQEKGLRKSFNIFFYFLRNQRLKKKKWKQKRGKSSLDQLRREQGKYYKNQ